MSQKRKIRPANRRGRMREISFQEKTPDGLIVQVKKRWLTKG